MMACLIVLTFLALLGLAVTNQHHQRRAQMAEWLAEEWRQRAAFLTRLITDIESENERLRSTPIVVTPGENVH